MKLKNLIESRIYIAPFNEPSKAILQEASLLNINVLSFVDSFKTETNVIHPRDVNHCDYDYVIIHSPNYWYQISENFDQDKVLLYRKGGKELISFNDYQRETAIKDDVDVLMLPFNKSNIIDMSLVSNELRNIGLSSILIDFDSDINENTKEGFSENPGSRKVHKDLIANISHKIIVASIDWEQTFARPLITKARAEGILTLGIVDGIEDFEDSDYDYTRNAYDTVENVLVMGSNDQEALEHKRESTSIIGLPKMFTMYRESVRFPVEDIVVINVNFTYGTFEESRDEWVNAVIGACDNLQLKYVIAQHHADNGQFDKNILSQANIYDTIRDSSIVVSRFSTVILEAVALGKPVVYFNPHAETVKLYQEPLGAYDIASTQNQLENSLLKGLKNKHQVRNNAFNLLESKCNISSLVPPAKLAAYRIKNLIEEKEKISLSSVHNYEIDSRYVARHAYHHYDDQACEDEWQLEVYLHALGLMTKHNFTNIADIGCGSGFKLMTYFKNYNTVGYELPDNVEILRKKYPSNSWETSDFSLVEKSIDSEVIICSDVIEHLVDPDDLMLFLQKQEFEYLILSTPDRDLVYAPDDPAIFGPPRNLAHQREWTFSEFNKYVSQFFNVIDHRVTHLEQATQMIMCTRKK